MSILEDHNWKELTPKELVLIIDNNYFEAKKMKLSRFSVEWGKWSVLMNTALRKRDKDPEEKSKPELILVYSYWQIKSKMLECHYQSKLLNMFTLKKYRVDAMKVKDIIINDKESPLPNISLEDFVKASVGKTNE